MITRINMEQIPEELEKWMKNVEARIAKLEKKSEEKKD